MATSSLLSPLLPRFAKDLRRCRAWRGALWRGACVGFLCLCLVFVAVRWWPSSTDEEGGHHLEVYSKSSTASDALKYLVVGDWGREGLYNQSQVAYQMGRIGEELDIKFVISVGDNFYDTGLTGVDDPAFTTSFTDVYTAQSLQSTWYTVLGNHDYMGDTLAQLSNELGERDSRWFCRRDFQLHYALAGTNDTSADLFFIDTTPFIDEYWQSNVTQTFDWRGLAPREEQLKLQLQNLGLNLKKSEATWKIVFGHHTIRSIGHHGDLTELVEQLLPILEEYEVDMYINGHDHNLQHIKRNDSSVHFFTSGGGSKAYSGLREYAEEDGVQFAYDGQGFLDVVMKPTTSSLTFHDVLGDALYKFVLEK